MKIRKTLIFIMLFFLTSLTVHTSTNAQEIDEIVLVKQAAKDGLAQFVLSNSETELALIGLGDIEDLGDISLAKPYRQVILPNEAINEYEPGDDVESYWITSDTYIFPVKVKGKIRAILTILKKEGNWTAVDLGGNLLAESIQKMNENMYTSDEINTYWKTEPSILVVIPELDETYFYTKDTPNQYLIPINYKIVDLSSSSTSNELYSASRVMTDIQSQLNGQ